MFLKKKILYLFFSIFLKIKYSKKEIIICSKYPT
jgi:hypothetical protein